MDTRAPGGAERTAGKDSTKSRNVYIRLARDAVGTKRRGNVHSVRGRQGHSHFHSVGSHCITPTAVLAVVTLAANTLE